MSQARKKEQYDTSKHVAPTTVQPTQPSSGSSRKPAAPDRAEQRDLLKKNVTERQGQRHPDTPAGQHATGSFTGENPEKK